MTAWHRPKKGASTGNMTLSLRLIAYSSCGGTILQVWRLPALVAQHTLRGHRRGVWAAVFSPVDQVPPRVPWFFLVTECASHFLSHVSISNTTMVSACKHCMCVWVSRLRACSPSGPTSGLNQWAHQWASCPCPRAPVDHCLQVQRRP